MAEIKAPRLSKRMKTVRSKVDRSKFYSVDDALKLVKDTAVAKFDESVDVAVNLGVDAKKSDQTVRGSVVLPAGTSFRMSACGAARLMPRTDAGWRVHEIAARRVVLSAGAIETPDGLIAIDAGQLVSVMPGTKRKIHPGPEGIRLLIIGLGLWVLFQILGELWSVVLPILFGLLLATGLLERLHRLDALLALALEHLQLFVLGQGPLKLLLGVLERVDDQAQGIAALAVARQHRLLDSVLDRLDPAHTLQAILPMLRPPRTCQCRWKTVCPAPAPALTTTR